MLQYVIQANVLGNAQRHGSKLVSIQTDLLDNNIMYSLQNGISIHESKFHL